MEGKKHRILYAFYSEKWVYKKTPLSLLEEYSIPVFPEEFVLEMRGKIFCPICATPLSRSPSVSCVSANSITAHFKHGSKEKYVESANCAWRTPAAQGLKYNTEEEARRAIENEELSIISSWMDEPPSMYPETDDDAEYSKTAIEDEDGPETEVAIGRHKGKSFKLPSILSTVKAICIEFPKNLKRGYFFPNSKYPMLLSDQLYSVGLLTDELPQNEALYFGKIISYRRLTYRNVITLLSNGIVEVKIYTSPSLDKRKRIDENSISRYILFWGKLYWESRGGIAASKVIKWGAYSLLPEKYNQFLPR